MGDTASLPAAGVRARAVARGRLTAGDIAWLALVPCALVAAAAVVVLGPPLGRTLFATDSPRFWEWINYYPPRPEPTENARFLLALIGPVLLSGVVLAGMRWMPIPRRGLVTAIGRRTTELLLVAFLAVCVVAQHRFVYDQLYGGPFERVYFTGRTLAIAGALTLLFAATLHARRLTARLASALRERTPLTIACACVALVATATWLLTSIVWDGSAGSAHLGMRVALPFWLDETYAVLDGRTPLVDFNTQYAHLLPYVSAGTMAVLGTTHGVFTTTMALMSGGALLAAYATLRRVSGNSIAALALYLPVLATGFFMQLGPLENRYGPANLLSIFPMRYFGPFLLAWLTVRHVDGAWPRRPALLFLVAGLVAINNTEFGIAALGATLAALLWTRPPDSRQQAVRLLGGCALGLAGAFAVVAAITLVRTGSLPHVGMLFTFARIDGVDGWTLLPMPTLGLHLAIYVTFAAAIVVATVRAVANRSDVRLTGMLVWAGVFGLGAGSYFVGRSHPEVLINLFSAWAFALALLTIAVVRSIVARPARLPSLGELAVLFGFGICVCSLAQTPIPWTQIERIRAHGEPHFNVRPEITRFVAAHTVPGERVGITLIPSHQIAYDAGVENVAPYVGNDSMPLERQLEETLDAMEHEGARKLFVKGFPVPRYEQIVRRHGFVVGAEGAGMLMAVDRTPGSP